MSQVLDSIYVYFVFYIIIITRSYSEVIKIFNETLFVITLDVLIRDRRLSRKKKSLVVVDTCGCSFARSSARSFVCSFIHSFVRSFFHSFVHSFARSFGRSFIRLFVLSFVQ